MSDRPSKMSFLGIWGAIGALCASSWLLLIWFFTGWPETLPAAINFVLAGAPVGVLTGALLWRLDN